MAKQDPYSVLGVGRNASDVEIKRAFRKKARQFHPDRNQGDASAEAKFKEVQAAYESIATAKDRNEYEQQQRMSSMFGGGGGGNPFGGGGRKGASLEIAAVYRYVDGTVPSCKMRYR